MLISITTGVVKIIDFGFAAPALHPLKMYCGTRSYMSPEIINKQTYMGKNSDIWSLGVVLYKLVTGEYAFGGIEI
jgi:serine/threonine protein kinase